MTRNGFRRSASSAASSSIARRTPGSSTPRRSCCLCERDGEPVGRISAHIDHRWDEFQGGSDGMFGFFDSTDDPEVAARADRGGERLARRARPRRGCSGRWTSP